MVGGNDHDFPPAPGQFPQGRSTNGAGKSLSYQLGFGLVRSIAVHPGKKNAAEAALRDVKRQMLFSIGKSNQRHKYTSLKKE